MIFGKLLGGLFGFFWLGFFGGLLGLYVGHLFDKGLARNFFSSQSQATVQKAFFRMTFIMMGRMAKADGRVTEHEIEWARYVMSRMNLSAEQRREAIRLFNLGKDATVDLAEELRSFRATIGRHATLIQMFLEIQIQAGYADGELNSEELAILRQACALLGVSALHFEAIHQRVRAEQAFTGGAYQQQEGARQRYRPQHNLQEAYKVLGVTAHSSMAEIKKAYRKLMSQHHPDKLVAQGLPEEMMRLAKEKTQEIQAAYETIKDNKPS